MRGTFGAQEKRQGRKSKGSSFSSYTTSQPQNLNPCSLTTLRSKGSSFGSYTTSQPQNLNPCSLTALRGKGSGFSSYTTSYKNFKKQAKWAPTADRPKNRRVDSLKCVFFKRNFLLIIFWFFDISWRSPKHLKITTLPRYKNRNPCSLTALRSKGSGFSSTKKQEKRRGSGSLGKIKKSENNQVKIPF